jgi:CRISPR/Cas system CSM-associated protein Csm2 small subunit
VKKIEKGARRWHDIELAVVAAMVIATLARTRTVKSASTLARLA